MHHLRKLIPLTLLTICFSSCSPIEDDSYLANCCSYVPYASNWFDYESKTLEITAAESLNRGTPVYLLVKATDFPSFLLDDYQKIAAQAINAEEDPSCLICLCVLPGMKKNVKIKVPEEKSIACYALFTHPENDWKRIIEPDETYTRLLISLGETSIDSLQLHKGPKPRERKRKQRK